MAALRGESKGKPPVSSVTQVGIVEAMQKVGAFWPQAHSDPEKMATVGSALYKLAGLKTARIPFCLTVEAEAMGVTVDMGATDRQPSVHGTPYMTADQIALPPSLLESGRVPVVLKATALLKRKEPHLPAIVGITGPFTLGGHLIGVEKYLLWTKRQPDSLAKVLNSCTTASVEYAKALVDAGADVITVSEPDASPDLLSPKDFQNVIKPKLAELGNAIAKKGGVGVLHICGSAMRIIKDMSETGFSALSVEEKVDLVKARELVGSKPLVGNISAPRTLLLGTPAQVRDEARKAIAAGVDVLAPGCGMAPRTPLDNVKALVDATL